MSQRYIIRRIPAFLALGLASLWHLPAVASASLSTISEEMPVRSLAPTAVSGVCTLDNGVFGTTSYGWTAPDAWYLVATRIRPSNCIAFCAAPSVLQLHSVSFRVRGLATCNATAEVSIVASNGDPLCPAPDTTQVLCPPVSYTLAITPGGVVHTLALSSACCIDDEAFVVVRFRDLGECDAAGNPLFLTASTSACTPCEQYFTTTQSHPSLTESCDWLSSPIWVSVDADCCEPVQALGSTWGRIKSLYR